MKIKKTVLFSILFLVSCFSGISTAYSAGVSGQWEIDMSSSLVLHKVTCSASSGCHESDLSETTTYTNHGTVIVSEPAQGLIEGRYTKATYSQGVPNKFDLSVSGTVTGNKVTFIFIQRQTWSGSDPGGSFDGTATVKGVFTGTLSGKTIAGNFNGTYESDSGGTTQGPRFKYNGQLTGPFSLKIVAPTAYVEPVQPGPGYPYGPSRFPWFDTKDPVNITTGNMYMVDTDLSVPGKGLNFDFTRTYNSSRHPYSEVLLPLDPGWSVIPANAFKLMGSGWTHNYNVLLQYNELTLAARIWDEYAKEINFVFNFKTGTYLPERGEHSTLVLTTSGFTWTKKDGKQYLFDKSGKLTQINDRWGNAITFTYEANNQLTRITDSAGRRVEFQYDANGRIICLSDAAGRKITYSYDASSNLVEVIDPAGNRTNYVYDGNMIRKTDSASRNTYFTYDGSGYCISSSYEGNLNRTELSYDQFEKKTVVTNSKGNTTTYYYNNDLMITKIVNAQGNQSTSTWDKDLNRISHADESGRVTNMQYDAKGNLTSLTDPAGNNTTYAYEPNFSLVTSIKDAQGNITANAYDAKGNLTKVTDTLGGSTFYSYNAAGLVTGSQNALGKTTYFSYDAQGNLNQIKDAVGAVTNNSYDAVGNMASSKDPKGNTTQFSYDNLNRLTQTTYSDNSTVSYGYDTVGNRISAVDQLGKTTYYTYDQSGKAISTTNALSGLINYTYDTEENLICVADQNNNKTYYSYDGLNRLTSQTDALGNTTSYSYDAVGNRTAVTDAKGQVTKYDYDNLNRLTKTTNPDSTTITYVYDSLDRRTSMTDPSGATTYAYDKLGRLLKVDGPLAKDTITYTYDAMGNRLTMIDPDAKTTKYAYDALNRISSITDPQNKVTSYVYDLNGNLTALTYPNATKAVYSYDKLNHLVMLTNQKSAAPNTKLSEYSYSYDLAGRKTRAALLDGSSITYAYDAIGQLTQETSTSTATPYSFTYTYDPAGNRTRKQANNGDYNYSYNSLNQLVQEDTRLTSPSGQKKITVSGKVSDKSFIDYVSVNGIKATLGSESFTCANVPLSLGQNTISVIAADVLGNTTSKVIHVTYEPGITTTQTKYTYDRNGNLITKEEPGQTSNLAYDSQNRLISFNSPGLTETYQYDSEGRRTSVRNTSTTTYLYDGMSVILERNASGATTTSYVRNPLASGGIGGIISSTAATQNYYHYDGIGTVTVLSNASGVSTQTYSCDAFGNILAQTGTATNNRNFLTKETDSTGLVFFGARYYDPKVGRFISKDPTGMRDGPNLYLYCRNDPIDYVDLWGLCTWFQDDSIKPFNPLVEVGTYAAILLTPKLLVAGLSASGNAVLYSGPGAKALAAASSGIPIFKTVIGGVMNRFELATGVSLPKFVWDAASAIYAATARGTVQVFLTESNYTSTFYRIETKIIELLGKAEMVFK